MRKTRVHPEAEAEMDEALDWYWERHETLALDFSAELKKVLRAIRRNPHAGLPYLRGTRRLLLNRFPYFAVFHEIPAGTEILAIAHAKRRPGYWAKRIEQ